MNNLSRSQKPITIPYKYILFISMLFVTVDLAAVSVAYRMVSINHLLQILSGATFIFPLTYCLGDIITEVYGYHLAKRLIWLSLLLQFIFALLITAVLYLPAPFFWDNYNDYIHVFGSILRFVFAGTCANICSNFLNIYLVSKLKIPFEGKLFWLRSIISTVLGGFLLVSIVVLVGFSGGEMNLTNTWIMFKSTFSLEVIYAITLAIPATYITNFLKKQENIDVYDFNINYNPFLLKATR